MKTRFLSVLLLVLPLLTGCIAVPPLIQVEHKETSNSDIRQRLDSIDRRLDRLEKAQTAPANK